MGFHILHITSNMLQKYKNANVVLLYEYMIDKYQYIDDDVWFEGKRFVHYNMNDFNDDLFLSNKLIRKYFDILKNNNAIEIKKFGIPSKNYYYLPYCNNHKFIGGY